MTLLEFLTNIVLPFVLTAFMAAIIYGQYLVLTERAEYKKKHGVDPWRHGWGHGWDKDDKQD